MACIFGAELLFIRPMEKHLCAPLDSSKHKHTRGNPSPWPDGTPPPTPAKRLFINQPDCSTAALLSASAPGSLGLRSSRETATETQRL
ncbi:uncharacterized [Tachysurus ichikawai]